MTEAPHPAAEDATEVPPLSPAPTPVKNVAFTLISVAIVVLLLQLMQSVLIPFVLGGLLFYALDPAVDRLQKMRVPRALGAAAMLLIVVTGCGALAYLLQGQALTVIDQLPVGARKLAATTRRTPGATPGAIEKVQQAADALQAADKPAPTPSGVQRVRIDEPTFQASTLVWSGSLGLMSAANQLVMILFLTYFMLLSDQLFKKKLVEIVGAWPPSASSSSGPSV